MCVGWTVAWVTGDGQHFAGDSKSVEPKHWNYSITFSKIAMPSRKKKQEYGEGTSGKSSVRWYSGQGKRKESFETAYP